MVRFCHSFSSRPLGLNMYNISGLRRLIGNVWYFALSVAYARRSGAAIVLHTDTLGKALLGHLPYDEVHLTLDDMPADISPRFWAAGKIMAQAAEPDGSIHIDGDVFIKRAELVERLDRDDWDVICQYREDSGFYSKEFRNFEGCDSTCKALGLDFENGGAFNCGIIGWRDDATRRAYTEGYSMLARAATSVRGDAFATDFMATPDLIAEQLWACQCARQHGARVVYLLGDMETCQATAREIGYQHVLTMNKFKEVGRVKAILKSQFPDIYESTYKLCKDL